MQILNNPEGIVTGLKTTQTIRTRYTANSEPRSIELTIDFTLAELSEVLKWASSERVISFQKRLRQLPNESAFDGFHELGPSVEILAVQAGFHLEHHKTLDELLKQQLNG